MSSQSERRSRYRRPCPRCGTPMDGSAGYNGERQPSSCLRCTNEERHANRYWTPATVVAALQAHAGAHGSAPSSFQWTISPPAGCPHTSTVVREFGSWIAAIAAAGLRPLRPHIPAHLRRRAVEAIAQGETATAVAATLGIHRSTVKRWCDEAGLAPRERPRLSGPKQTIPYSLRWAVWLRDDFRCQRCGTRERLTADHVIPESKGGPTTLENLQTLCAPCNSKKGTRG